MEESLSGLNDSLHLATKRGDAKAVVSLLKQRLNVEAVDTMGWTALHYACERGFLSIAKLLLDNGASPHTVVVTSGKRALHIAASYGYEDLVSLLLRNGADVHAVDNRGYTALLCAAQTLSEDTIQQLLSYGADISAVTHDGRSALSLACRNGSPFSDNVGKLLIRSGADVYWLDTRCNKRGFTLVHYAAVNAMIETMQLLLDKQVDVDAVTEDGRTALHMACQRRVLKAVQCLLQNGAGVRYPSRNGFTALHSAVRHEYIRDVPEYVQVVELLFKYRADVNAENEEGCTPLDLALRESRIEVFKVFVKQVMYMIAQEFFVSEHNLKAISENEEGKNFSASCEKEIERMRKSTIGDSSVKIYDIFTKGPNRLADFMSNENVELVLESGNYMEEFPIYAGAIGEKFSQGRERRDLLRQCSDWLWSVISELHDLPYVCVQRINRCLTNTDLALQISHEPSQQEAVCVLL